MRVYYIGNKYDGCYYVRCLQPLIHNGWDGERTSLRAKPASSDMMTQACLQSDVVVFQRPDDPKKVESIKLLKLAGKKVVFDNDDTYKPDSGTPTQIYSVQGKNALRNKNSNLDAFMAQADLVTTTTEFLADEYRKKNDNVIVLPNMVDPDDWEEPLKNEGKKVRIGLVGSVASNKDYAQIIPVLDAMKEIDEIQLVLFALPADVPGKQKVREIYREEIDFWSQYDPEWHHFVPLPEYFDALNELRLDIMLIPREDSYFNRCKSNLKFLEAAMCEVPVIARSFEDGNSPYDKDIEHGETGYLVQTVAEWVDCIEDLVENPDKRKAMGKKAKKYVLENFNIHNNYHLWEEAYQTLYE